MMPRKCLLLFVLCCGCDGSLAVRLPAPAEPTPVGPNDRYDATTNGTVTGRVTWAGDVPTVPTMVVSKLVNMKIESASLPNPNAPRVAKDGGVQSAVVWLRGVDPRRAKANRSQPVVVEVDAAGMKLLQNGLRMRTAFIPLGTDVTFENKQAGISGVRGRGASFFTHILPAMNATSRRTFTNAGRVELTSASGQYWTVADLFVGEHPYFARTDDDGRFTLQDVPDGEYELVCWHPNWHVAGHERDPETGMLARQSYRPAVEKSANVRVTAQNISTSHFSISASDFLPPAKP